MSPVIIATSIPISWSFIIALALLSLTISATAIIPAILLFIAIYIGVLPSAANLSDISSNFLRAIFLSCINFLLPNKIPLDSISTSIPWPGIATNLSILYKPKFFFSPSLTIASPRGCSEPFSALAAIFKSSSLLISPSVIISVTTGFPSVIVPVLSNTIVFILWVDSNASPPFISIPFSAPFPVPTIIAVGVASPNAHGQAITRTAINILRANSISFPDINQAIDTITAIANTIGTK